MNTYQFIAAVKDLSLNGLPHASADANAFQTFLSVITTIVGAMCLLIIVIGGFRYILSQGDPQGVAKAKATIVYALIGLVIVIFARAIVAFVFGRLQ
jgi:SNF family Na+-dependent transporter